MSELAILDASVYLKFGTHFSIGKEAHSYGVPVGGIIALLRGVKLALRNNYDVMVTFDSKTNRRDYMPEYKSNRKLDYKFRIQVGLAYTILKRIGIHVVKMDGYESDDLIVKAVEMNKPDYNKIYVYTNDMDLSQVVDSAGKVQTVSPTVLAMSINKDNFEYSVCNGEYVEFNTILIHKVLFGDKSDHISALNLRSGRKGLFEIEQQLITIAKKMYTEPADYNKSSVPITWLKSSLASVLDEDEKQEFMKRLLVFYPKSFTAENAEKLKCIPCYRLNILELERAATVLGDIKLAQLWSVDLLEEKENISSFMYTIKRIYNKWQSEDNPDFSILSEDKVETMYDEIFNPINTGDF